MRASIAFLAPLLALAMASPYPFVKRQNTSLATSYTLTGFSSFTPSVAGKNGSVSFSVSDNNAVSFSISDNLENVAACSHVGPSLPGTSIPCENNNFSFIWDDVSSNLTLFEQYSVTGRGFLAATSVAHLELLCVPEEPPFPLGAGSLCQSYSGQIGGTFVALTT